VRALLIQRKLGVFVVIVKIQGIVTFVRFFRSD